MNSIKYTLYTLFILSFMILGNNLNKPGYPLQNSPTGIFANSYKSLRMRTISTSHKHYNNFGRIYIGDVLKFTQFVRRNICGEKY
jgi:hypothetical protein